MVGIEGIVGTDGTVFIDASENGLLGPSVGDTIEETGETESSGPSTGVSGGFAAAAAAS